MKRFPQCDQTKMRFGICLMVERLCLCLILTAVHWKWLQMCVKYRHVLITGLCVCVRVGSGASPGGVIEKTRGAGEKSRRAGPQGERDAVSERIGRWVIKELDIWRIQQPTPSYVQYTTILLKATCVLYIKFCMSHTKFGCKASDVTLHLHSEQLSIILFWPCYNAGCSIIANFSPSLFSRLTYFSVCQMLLSKGGKTTGPPSQRSFLWDRVSITTYQWTSQWNIRKPLRSCTISGCVSNSWFWIIRWLQSAVKCNM